MFYQPNQYSPPSQHQREQSSAINSSYLPSTYLLQRSKLIMEPCTWSAGQVEEWLIKNNLQQYNHLLCGKHRMDGMTLMNLRENDVLQLEVPNNSDNKELWSHIKQLQQNYSNNYHLHRQYTYQQQQQQVSNQYATILMPSSSVSTRTTSTTSDSLKTKKQLINNTYSAPVTSSSLNHSISFYNNTTANHTNNNNINTQSIPLLLNTNRQHSNTVSSNLNILPPSVTIHRPPPQIGGSENGSFLDNHCTLSGDFVPLTTFTDRNITPTVQTAFSTEGHRDRTLSEHIEDRENVNCCIITTLRSDRKKTLCAFLIAIAAAMFCSFIIVIVDERLPDPKRHPPLPDLILDNIPQMKWAFTVTEYMIVIEFSTLVAIIMFHRHRLIILRRFFIIAAALLFLRGLTMVFTSLPVATKITDCKPHRLLNMTARLKKALFIFIGQGLSVYGVRTCGDYLYSGHTCTLILSTHFINEYSPRSYHLLHLLTWLMAFTGIFFILAGHQHYSIDVLIAGILASRLFIYYHMLANNKTFLQRDIKRMRIWLPLFVYFEENVLTAIPNEYCCPIFLRDLKTMIISSTGTTRYKRVQSYRIGFC
ncbi:unnamed protein product [Didymodactylos carnosus]|uniref:SAM domain-containing protein n=1 Tax=Didymodactylos carnosus TaxID=1234261 RepID=A0A814IKV9_9BILA|nr:unnamed protein product [Didymodactylos carnosus]CAF1432820.1 unnamed protein product [Didymodactylos carnosus]CAF3796112.1 unnamed protein product [Didymodactylos carnosus]CAF4230560.1 unnamed protein product [Didymodactylos carnosus]